MSDFENSPPRMIVDENATPEQEQLLNSFWSAAERIPSSQLGAALTFAEFHPAATQDVLPLVEEPTKFSDVFELWKRIISTKTYELIHFDDTSEDIIAQNPSIQTELARRVGANPDQKEVIRKNIVRERFVIFAGRLATYNSIPKTSNTEPTLEEAV